jgi:superkiller protein 3
MRKIADAYRAAKNDTAAADWYVRLFDLDPKLYEPLLLTAAGLYVKARSFDKAADCYERYFKEGFTSLEATAAYARILYSRKEWKKVIDQLKPFTGSPAAKKEVLLMLADAYCRTDGYEEAVPVLITLHAMAPQDPRILELSAIASEQTGNLAKAALLYDAYLKYKTDKAAAEYAYHAGEIYEKLGRFQDAVSRYEKNCATFPRDVRSYKRLAELYQAYNDWTNVKRTVEKAMSRMPVPPAMTKVLAEACAALGEKQRAAYLYQTYLDREPKDEAAWLALGTVLFEQKKYKRAIKPLAFAAKKNPKNFKCQSMLGFARLRLGRYGDALDALEKAHDINPRDIATLERMAKCQRALKQRNQLIATLRDWAELEPGRYDVTVEAAGLLLAKKDYDEAVKYAKAALKIKPGDPTARRIIYRATKKRK